MAAKEARINSHSDCTLIQVAKADYVGVYNAAIAGQELIPKVRKAHSLSKEKISFR